MPPSDNDRKSSDYGDSATPGQSLAVAAEALYLANLLLAPGLAFAIIVALWLRHRHSASPLALCHLKQTLSASLWAGVLLVAANLLIILLGGYGAPATWMIVIMYFTVCHTTLVMLGIIGLAKAMAGRRFVYPLIGRPCEDEHPD